MSNIPKKIHYCWFGGKPLPKLAQKCIESWKKYLPDYEIIEWNESNFNVNIIPYTSEAYNAKKYAFVSDYARFWILYHYGGLYFDTDVEVIKPIDNIIVRGSFMGCENEALGNVHANVAPGLGLGAYPGLELYNQILLMYSKEHFINNDNSYNLKTVVTYVTELLIEYGLKVTNEIQMCADILIYPKEYFCPIDYFTGNFVQTDNTCSIHWYTASWVKKDELFKKKFKAKFPKLYLFIRGIYKKIL